MGDDPAGDARRRLPPAARHRPRAAGRRPGLACVDVGAGGGDVSVALAEVVGRDGRVYAVDSDPLARDLVAAAAAAHSQVLAITQAGEDLVAARAGRPRLLPVLLLHVVDPSWCSAHGGAVRPGGWVVAQEPITSAGGSAARRCRCPSPPSRRGRPAAGPGPRAGLDVVDAWAEAPPAWAPAR